MKIALTRYQAHLDILLKTCIQRATYSDSLLKKALNYSALNGGKRFRPFLIYAIGRALNVPDTQLDMAACAVELMHCYSLVHDDLPAMDNADLRRGKPTCHLYFDEATAILAGDALQSLAFQCLAKDIHLTPEKRCQMICVLSDACGCQGMVEGQMRDLQINQQTRTVENLNALHQLKTGALITACTQLALIASDHEDVLLEDKLIQYAKNIGLAFQIQDDILDVEGSTHILGKTQNKDSASQKITYPTLLGMEKAKEIALSLSTEALQILDDFDENAQLLRELARYVVNRAY